MDRRESNFSMGPISMFQHIGAVIYLLIKLKENSQLSTATVLLDNVTVRETPNACDWKLSSFIHEEIK